MTIQGPKLPGCITNRKGCGSKGDTVDRIHRQIALQAQILGGSTGDATETDSIQTQWPRIR